jgi:hypothetical protein
MQARLDIARDFSNNSFRENCSTVTVGFSSSVTRSGPASATRRGDAEYQAMIERLGLTLDRGCLDLGFESNAAQVVQYIELSGLNFPLPDVPF